MNFYHCVILLFFSMVNSAWANEFTLNSDKALALHVSPRGFDQLGTALSNLLPSSITIAEGTGSFECSDDTLLEYTLTDMDVALSIDQTTFDTENGFIALRIYGTLASSAATLTAAGSCSIFSDLDDTCSVQVPTTSFSMATDISISYVNDQFLVDVSEIDFYVSPITNPVSDCLLSDVVDTILGQNPNLINDLISDAVEPELESLPASLEESIEDALNSLSLTTEFELLDATIGVAVKPSIVEIDTRGVILGLSATVSGFAPDNHCADYSMFTPSEGADWPSFDGQSLSSTLSYDFGIFVSKHLFDQLLYGTWMSGALCLDVEELAGLSFTGEFASGFFGEQLNELVGQQPIELLLQAQRPPSVVFDDDQPPVSVELNDFALKVMGPVDHRKVRILQVDMSADVGIDIALQDDVISLSTGLGSNDFILSEAYSDLMPQGYSENVPDLLDLALGSFIPQLPSFGVPSILGLSIGPLVWEPSSDQSWQGGYLFLDPSSVTPLAIPGCSASDLACDGGGSSLEIDIEDQLGCDEAQTGCTDDTGCSTNGKVTLPAGRIFGLLLVLSGALLRRRSRSVLE